MLLVHNYVVGYVVDVVGALIGPFASALLVLWARVPALVQVLRLVISQQRADDFLLFDGLFWRLVNLFLFLYLVRQVQVAV